MRRAAAHGRTDPTLYEHLIAFSGAIQIEGVHPLQIGLFRRKIRTSRRAGMPIAPPLVFYPRRLGEIIRSAMLWVRAAVPTRRAWTRIMKDPARFDYRDLAITPVGSDDSLTDFVSIFEDKIPNTHGAPKRRRPATKVGA